jgi:hypothetical protein
LVRVFAHDGVEELARRLGIAVGKQLHGTLEVGEEHRDLLALALEGGLRGEDLLGEVPRGVRLWGGRTNRDRSAPDDGLAALEAEAGPPGSSAPQAPQASVRRAPQPRQNRA